MADVGNEADVAQVYSVSGIAACCLTTAVAGAVRFSHRARWQEWYYVRARNGPVLQSFLGQPSALP